MSIWQKRPILWQERPIPWQNRAIYTAKEGRTRERLEASTRASMPVVGDVAMTRYGVSFKSSPVQGLGFRVYGLGFGVLGLGLRV